MYLVVAGECGTSNLQHGSLTQIRTCLVFAAIRMYAIWNRDSKVFACVLALGLIYPIVNTVSEIFI